MHQSSTLRVVTGTKLDIVNTIDKKTQYFLKQSGLKYKNKEKEIDLAFVL